MLSTPAHPLRVICRFRQPGDLIIAAFHRKLLWLKTNIRDECTYVPGMPMLPSEFVMGLNASDDVRDTIICYRVVGHDPIPMSKFH